MGLTDHQLARRYKDGRVPASDVAAVCGLDPYKSPADIYFRMVHGVDPAATNEFQSIGHVLEDSLIDWMAETVGKVRKNQRRVHESAPVAATLDAIDARPDPKFAVEAKTAGLLSYYQDTSRWGHFGTDETPDEIVVQCQTQMACADLEVDHVPALIGGRGLGSFEIIRDEELIRELLDRATEFVRRNVREKIVPDGPPASLETLKRVRRIPESIAEIDPFYFDAWMQARENRLRSADVEKSMKRLVLQQIGNCEAGACKKGGLTYLEQTSRAKDCPHCGEELSPESKSRKLLPKSTEAMAKLLADMKGEN